MKPKDLKRLYTFEERRPLLEDSIFYVPIYYVGYELYTLPPFSEIFGNQNPISIEYCSGNGDWILERAKSYPDQNWIAVELRFDRVRKIWSKMKNAKIDNLLIVCGEAYTFTKYYLLEASIESAYIHFPDPWPKHKHAKNRLTHSAFLNELARVLAHEKTLTFVTDDLPYLKETIHNFQMHPCFTPFFLSPHYTIMSETYGDSWFEKLWREQGRQIHYTQFSKKVPLEITH